MKYLNKKNVKTLVINFGPQHPAAHGILKIPLYLSGDVIIKSDPVFGLLHRGSEKLMEKKTYNQSLPYLDRMDYVSNLIQEHAFISTIEGFFNLKSKPNLTIIRIIFDELSRVLNHLLTVSAICLDMGSMGPIFWAFEEREQILEIFERVSGARMHTALYKPFSFSSNSFYKQLSNDIFFLLRRGSRFLSGSFLSLLNNRSMRSRLSYVGCITINKINEYGVTGIIARSSGLFLDLRISGQSYYSNTYKYLGLTTFVGSRGDSFDRFIIRAKEVFESFKIITCCLNKKPFILLKNKKKNKKMEDVINSFNSSWFFKLESKSINFSFVESPKGFVGVFIVNNNNILPYRVQVKSPVACNMNLIRSISNGVTFADFVATFCSLDVVLGEIDR